MTLKIYRIENKRTSTNTLTVKVTMKIRSTKADESTLETSIIASPTPIEVNEKETSSTLIYYPLFIIIIIMLFITGCSDPVNPPEDPEVTELEGIWMAMNWINREMMKFILTRQVKIIRI